MILDFVQAYAFSPSCAGTRVSCFAAIGFMVAWTSLLGASESYEFQQGLQWKAHVDGVFAVACSAKGDRVVSGGGDKLVKLWDARSGKIIHTFQGHQRPVTSLTFSPNDQLIASGDLGGKVIIWDVLRKMRLCILDTQSPYTYQLTFSPDSRLLVTGGNSVDAPTHARISSWTTSDGKCLSTTNLPHTPICMAFVKTTPSLLIGDESGKIHLLDVSTKQFRKTFLGHKADVLSLTVLANGSAFASAGEDGIIRVWDIERGRKQSAFCCEKQRIVSISASPTLPLLASVGFRYEEDNIDTGELNFWSLDARTHLARVRPRVGALYSVRFDSSGKRLFVGADDGVLRSWDVTVSKRPKP
jgi:WD40 repeat protein